ncbi:hypothetical protein CSM81_23590 [Salmonella enterica subsp. enterica serovar Infantis]|nr:hypothetical protein [Salmonella enterica subsp. enterica serovar Infantis]
MSTENDGHDNNEMFAYIYQMLQTKLIHVQYTTQKVMKIQHQLSTLPERNQQSVESLTTLINQLHALRIRLKNKILKSEVNERHLLRKVATLMDTLSEQALKIQQDALLSAELTDTAANSLLITVLKAHHYQWREKVYMSVLTRSHNIPREDELTCALGQWYHTQGQVQFSHLPAFRTLGIYHSRLHQVEKELTKTLAENAQCTVILKKLKLLEDVSLAVINTLDDLDNYIINIAKNNDR